MFESLENGKMVGGINMAGESYFYWKFIDLDQIVAFVTQPDSTEATCIYAYGLGFFFFSPFLSFTFFFCLNSIESFQAWRTSIPNLWITWIKKQQQQIYDTYGGGFAVKRKCEVP